MITYVLEQLLLVPEPLTLLHAGAALRTAGELAFARPLLMHAYDMDPTARASFELGMLHVSEDGPESAEGRRLLNRALEVEPDNIDYRSAARQLDRART